MQREALTDGAHALTHRGKTTVAGALYRARMNRELSPRLHRRANALGWFSVGLGLAEILAPSWIARGIGARNRPTTRVLIRSFGVRKLATGVGILMRPHPTEWLWGRVAGDALDIALLARTFAVSRKRGRTALALAAATGVTLADTRTALEHHRGVAFRYRPGEAIFVKKSITINRAPHEVYTFFRNLENLPRFMAHLDSVEVQGELSHWRVTGPAGTLVEWDAEIIKDRPGELLSWRSLEGADVRNRGAVEFRTAPGDRGTELHIELRYEPPFGIAGAALAKLFGEEPAQQVGADLRRLKQLLEAGEVVHSDASIHRGMHAARPPLSPVTGEQLGLEPFSREEF